MNSLSQLMIHSIKQAISATTGRFTFDISDSEVFEEVDYRLEEENSKVGFERNEFITWNQAAEMCMDDWGVCYALGYC